MKSSIGVYMSEWGAFEIPDDMKLEMYDCHKPSILERLLKLDRKPVMEIAPLPKNAKFWQWLSEQEASVRKSINREHP